MVRTKQTHKITHKNAIILKNLKHRLVHNKKKLAPVEVLRKPRRWHPGTVAKREIRKLSRSTNLLFPKLSFNRLVREVCQNVCADGKSFTSNAILAIQEAAEVYVTETFHKANMARMHSGRETLGVKVTTPLLISVWMYSLYKK
jgi:histone H3